MSDWTALDFTAFKCDPKERLNCWFLNELRNDLETGHLRVPGHPRPCKLWNRNLRDLQQSRRAERAGRRARWGVGKGFYRSAPGVVGMNCAVSNSEQKPWLPVPASGSLGDSFLHPAGSTFCTTSKRSSPGETKPSEWKSRKRAVPFRGD